MSPLRTLMVAASLLALAACTTVGPNYKLPDQAKINAPTAQGPFLGATSTAVSQDPVPAGWWKLYDDPVLNGLVQEALAANTDLRVAAANLARARAIAGETDDAGGFKAGVSAAAMHSRESGEQFLLAQPLPVENLADVGAKVSYQVDLVGRLRRAAEAAHADAEASQAALDLARVTVAADVARAYVEACANGHEQAVAQRTLDLQSRSLTVTQTLVKAGRGTAVDITRAQAQLDLSRANLPTFQSRRRAALYKLATLTGKPPAEFPKAVEVCVAPPTLRQPIPVGDGAALLKRRPDVRQAEAGADAALARFDGVVLTALRETETSLDAYAHDLDRNAALKAARDQAAKAESQAQTLYRAGRSPYLAGLDAQRTLAGAEAALAASDSQVAADQVNLFLALGGGWEAD
jgi:multidrug efflux system outer membrane protein